MVKDEQYWLRKLATLRVDRTRGNPAPHKPLLLLVILEMAEKGEIPSQDVALSPDLAFRFSVFWSVVAQRRRRAQRFLFIAAGIFYSKEKRSGEEIKL